MSSNAFVFITRADSACTTTQDLLSALNVCVSKYQYTNRSFEKIEKKTYNSKSKVDNKLLTNTYNVLFL